MINFKNKKYELFFSNNLPPLIALNYADELFFDELEKLGGARYRILSIIKHGWQEKYILLSDVKKLEKVLRQKIYDKKWIENIFNDYNKKTVFFRKYLRKIKQRNYIKSDSKLLIRDLRDIRNYSGRLDAMNNLLHLFSSLIGGQFLKGLKKYDFPDEIIKQNFIFYTQPIKSSKLAKIKIKSLPVKIELNSEDQNFSKILRVGAFIKDDVSVLLAERQKCADKLFDEIAKKIRCPKNDLSYLQLGEIKKALLDNFKINNLTKQRRKITILYYPKKFLNIFEGDRAVKFLQQGKLLQLTEKQNNKILKGEMASLGKAKGRIKVSLTSDEANKKMNSGDILTAPYTAVEYLPAMRKASAIITETGGITSHAAIISRELKIPCIVGVKNATKILKDGDEVEVNAEKGVIKKIN